MKELRIENGELRMRKGVRTFFLSYCLVNFAILNVWLSRLNRYFSTLNSQFSIQRGFTLIELLVVMVIIGLLSTLGVVNYLDARVRARDAQRKANLHSIQFALELYRSDQSAYPAALPVCGNPFRDPTNTTTYMPKLPCDPTNTAPHTYTYTLSGSTYTLRACLENERDGQRDTTNSAPCNGTTNASYTVTTP